MRWKRVEVTWDEWIAANDLCRREWRRYQAWHDLQEDSYRMSKPLAARVRDGEILNYAILVAGKGTIQYHGEYSILLIVTTGHELGLVGGTQVFSRFSYSKIPQRRLI